MTNLAKSQASWNKFGKELGLLLGVRKFLVDGRRKFNNKYNRTQVVEINDTAASTSAWALSGVVIGTNTDENGLLYVRITDESPGAGQATVNLYKTTGGGGGDLVATGSAANGATVTLAASNSSGLTGSLTLGTVGASESNDLHRLQVFPDWGLRANALFDGSETEHTQALRSFLAMCAQVETLYVAMLGIVDSAVLSFMLDRGANFHQSSQTTLINRSTTDDEGSITTTFVGLLEDIRQNMVDEATAGAQAVAKNTVSAASVSFDSNNQGLGAMTAPTMKEWALPGLLSFVCVDATVGREKFRVTQKITTTGEVRTAQKFLEVGQPFADPNIGIASCTLTRTHTITTPASSTLHFNTTSSNWSFTDESDKNTNDGILYGVIAAGTDDPAKFVIKLYKSSSAQTSQLVAQSAEGAAADSVGLNSRNNSGLSGTAKLGSAPVVANTATINLNTFRTQNSAASIPDKFTSLVSVTTYGEFQKRIAELGYALRSATSGSETLHEGYVKAGTFLAYEVTDA